jgi:hypothetical protein
MFERFKTSVNGLKSEGTTFVESVEREPILGDFVPSGVQE